MKTTPTTLKLRAHSIRNLTAAELRGAHGGKSKDPTVVSSFTQEPVGTRHSPPPQTHK